MLKWPPGLQRQFFDEMQALTDVQCNLAISNFCVFALTSFCPTVSVGLFSSSNLDTRKAKITIEELGNKYWGSVDALTPNDPCTQTLFTYLFWSVRNHYDVDGAMEVMDDLVDSVAEVDGNVEVILLKVFDILREVRKTTA